MAHPRLLTYAAQLDGLERRLKEKGVDMTTERKYGMWKESVDAQLTMISDVRTVFTLNTVSTLQYTVSTLLRTYFRVRVA